jgi:hypothetical protein
VSLRLSITKRRRTITKQRELGNEKTAKKKRYLLSEELIGLIWKARTDLPKSGSMHQFLYLMQENNRDKAERDQGMTAHHAYAVLNILRLMRGEKDF